MEIGWITRPLGLAALLLVLVLLPAELRADSGVTIATPIGWSTDDPGRRARERVSTWLMRRADARAQLVLTTGSADDFAEAIAVIEIDGPYDDRNGEAAELERAIDRLMPYDAGTAEVASASAQGERPAMTTAGWTKGTVAYRAALVPSGHSRTLVVLATLASEAPLYGRAFDEALAGLRGAEAAVRPFEHGRWRMLALGAWTLSAALLLALVLWRRPFGIRYEWIGRSLALVFFVAAVVAGYAVHGRMALRSVELRRAGLSPETLTAETVSYGIATAIVCWIIGAVLSRRERPVESAPMSGAFAGRASSSSSLPQIPIVPKNAKPARPRHPDGASRLDPVTEPELLPPEPRVEPRDGD